MDSQVVELLGRNWLVSELLRAGLEVATPMRDRGIDLIAYADLDDGGFVARPIQMKASSGRSLGIDRKYEKFPGLLIAFVWDVADPRRTASFALGQAELVALAGAAGWTTTSSWSQGGVYSTTRPSKALEALLEPYRMTPERWRAAVTQAAPAPA